MLLAVILAIGIASCQAEPRQPKFFFVSSSTSTSVTTTTSVLGAKVTCLILSKTKYVACKRRRRNLALTDNSLVKSDAPISVTRVERAISQVPELESAKGSSNSRQGRFAWYYMTTTLTSTSTFTSTSTSFTSTVSVSALACTPTEFLGCGGR